MTVAVKKEAKTDSQLKVDVEAELKWDPRVNVNEIGVAVRNGIVTLTGSVDSYSKRYAAEEATHRVRGVKAVANDVEVHLPNGGARSDSDIAAAAVRALEWDAMVNVESLDVTVARGWVTLKGSVNWAFEKHDAERVVQRLIGVRGVSNMLTIKPRVMASDLRQLIEQALVRTARSDASHITVTVEGGKVVLTGQVSSYAEKQEAERTAYAAVGVTSVDNRITVSLDRD